MRGVGVTKQTDNLIEFLARYYIKMLMKENMLSLQIKQFFVVGEGEPAAVAG